MYTFCRALSTRSDFYTGLTDDLRDRLKAHNAGRIRHTATWRPWRLKTYVAVSNRIRAAKLERYFKSSSGRAFIKKHLQTMGCASGSEIPRLQNLKILS